jgi:amino-acid N-acetyltransferase
MDSQKKPKKVELVLSAEQSKIYRICKEDDWQGCFLVRKARIEDVTKILELLNYFAVSNLMLPRGPQYLYENIRDFVVITEKPIKCCNDPEQAFFFESDDQLVACTSLHVLWGDFAEIRSAAVRTDYQKLYLGTILIDYLKEDANRLGIKTLFTFTLAADFFHKQGFRIKDKSTLPSRVWVECSRCPKYFECDEVGMTCEL